MQLSPFSPTPRSHSPTPFPREATLLQGDGRKGGWKGHCTCREQGGPQEPGAQAKAMGNPGVLARMGRGAPKVQSQCEGTRGLGRGGNRDLEPVSPPGPAVNDCSRDSRSPQTSALTNAPLFPPKTSLGLFGEAEQ